jgi:HTH-type transcriptional regulator / antitoxin HipB
MKQLITTPAQVGEILRGRRKSRRIPQRELAAKVGVSQGRLSTLEAHPASITLDRLLAVAHLLGLELVLQDSSSAPPPKTEW